MISLEQWSQSLVPRIAASSPPGNNEKCKFLGPIPELPNQKFPNGGWAQQSVFYQVPQVILMQSQGWEPLPYRTVCRVGCSPAKDKTRAWDAQRGHAFFLIPWGSLKSENSASIALRGNEGSRRRSSWSMETWDCLWAVGIFWVREMRNKTRPTSSSFRVNT